jgi:hypothetical protein
MSIHIKLISSFLVVVLSVSFIGCAAKTIYSGTPATELTDEQLVEELHSTLQGLGVAVNRTQYLMAVRPEPAYVLTSSTTSFSGILNANYNSYSMPVGYGVSTSGTVSGNVHGSSSTQYYYTDVNAGERIGNTIATLINQAKEEAYRKRGKEVWAEYQRRVQVRRTQIEQSIEEFFLANPALDSRRLLVAAVAPWAAAEGHTDSLQILERSKEIIENLSRGSGLSGKWYGILSQTTINNQGQEVSFNNFIQIDLEESAGKITGNGKLGSNEIIEMSGQVNEQKITGVVANITSAINVLFSGIATNSQITAEYVGSGAGQRMNGTVVLLR